MTIYRGPGGTGDATSDSDTTEFQQFLIQTVAAKDAAIVAEIAAETAASATSGSASSAATSATAAASSASAASTSATNAATSASTASAQAVNAEASAIAAAISAASVNDANLVHKTGDETIAGIKTFSSNPIINGGTTNGVTYLNGSKVLTSGSALVFDGSNLGLGAAPSTIGSFRVFTMDGTSGSILSMKYNGTVISNNYVDATGLNLTTQTATPIIFQTNGAERMRLDSSGNLGLGTASPTPTFGSNVLQLYGSTQTEMRFTSGSSGTTSTDGFSIGIDASNVTYVYNRENTALVFGTNNTERARIDSSGNLLVGTTGLTGYRLSVQMSASTPVRIDRAANTGNLVDFSNGAGVLGNISTNSFSISYNTTSDYRLKTVIGAVTNAGERIDALEPVEYEWKADGSRTRGFLAHRFQEVYAGSVMGSKDAVDAEGNPVYQAMQASSSEVIADLIAELQSVRKRLAALEAA